jgi:hypothetical protein
MNTISSKHINATYIAIIFSIVFLSVANCSDGKKAETEANNVGEKTQADSVEEVLTWNCGDSGGNIIATLKDDTTLIVSGMGAMANYDSDNTIGLMVPWYSIRDRITNLVIEHGVISIGNNAFKHFIHLTSVIIPNSVRNIGDGAFSNCSAMVSVTIPNSVMSIGAAAFSFSGLMSVVIPDSVTFIGSLTFVGCKKMTSVTFHERLKSIQDFAFAGCISLTSVTLPDSVWDIGMNAFDGCANLMSIIIPKRLSPPATDYCGSFGDLDAAKQEIYFNRACLYVPANSIAAYRASKEQWQSFKCIKPVESAIRKGIYNIR